MHEQNQKNESNTVSQIYSELKNQIMWGKIEAETLLSESVLAKQFGTSRTPIREALARLAADGLVSSLPQRGHLVRSVSLAEMLDAFHVRELLETEAAGLAVEHISERDILALRELANTINNPDLPAVNREFHLIIAHASGNRILYELIERLLVSMQRILIVAPQAVTWEKEVAEEELAIVDALAKRNADAAREAMSRHIRNTLASVLRQTRLR